MLNKTEATVKVMSLSICVPYQNAAATRTYGVATTTLPPQHTAEAILGVMSECYWASLKLNVIQMVQNGTK